MNIFFSLDLKNVNLSTTDLPNRQQKKKKNSENVFKFAVESVLENDFLAFHQNSRDNHVNVVRPSSLKPSKAKLRKGKIKLDKIQKSFSNVRLKV